MTGAWTCLQLSQSPAHLPLCHGDSPRKQVRKLEKKKEREKGKILERKKTEKIREKKDRKWGKKRKKW